MKKALDFVDAFLEHRGDYDPAAAREYYLRTRKLKGRKAAAPIVKAPTPAAKAVNPGSKLAFRGGPLNKLGTRIEEDETPVSSPSGAQLTTYDQGPHDLGRATYADGSVYDAKTGWSSKAPAPAPVPVAKVNKSTNRKQRMAQVQKKMARARRLANRISDPQRKREVLRRLANAEQKLEKTRKKYGSRAALRRRTGV